MEQFSYIDRYCIRGCTHTEMQEELAWTIDKRLWVITNIMFLKESCH